MRAVMYQSFRQMPILSNVPEPELPADGIILEVKASGICRSDWHAWMGHDPMIILPHVPGHEMAGVIAEVGKEVRNWKIGEGVTLPFCLGCGVCTECQAGHQHICDSDYQPGFSAWGSFAQYVAIPRAESNLVRLPESIGFVEAAALGCRFMTAFHGLVDQAKVRAGEYLAVHGCGGVGLSAIIIGSALGLQVIAIDIDDQKLERAISLGALHTINAQKTDVVQSIKDVSLGGAHVSMDALGSSITSQNSICCLRKRGRHVQIGLTLAEEAFVSIPMYQVIAKELTIIGSHGMQAHRYPEMLAMIETGKLKPEALIGKTISLEMAGEELASMGTFRQQGVTVIHQF